MNKYKILICGYGNIDKRIKKNFIEIDINEFYYIKNNLIQLEERLQNNLKVKYI